MESRSSISVDRLRAWSRAAAAAAAFLGGAVLAGRALDLEFLKSGIAGEAAVRSSAAAFFLAAGVSASILAWERPHRRLRLAAKGLGALVAGGGLAMLAEYLVSQRGPMAPAEALAFLLTGCALVVHDAEARNGGRPAQLLALIAALVPLQALIGRAYGVEPSASLGPAVRIALLSGVGFVLLCFALLFDRPEAGIVRVFTAPGPAGFMARRLVLAILLLPVALGWVFLVGGLRYGVYGTLAGGSFVVVSAIVIGAAVVWWSARALEELEAGRVRAEAAGREQRERLRTTVASIGDAVIATDVLARVTLVNPVAETLTGWREAEARGRPLPEVFRAIDEDSGAPIEPPAARVFESGALAELPRRTLLHARCGGEHPVEGSAAPIQDDAGATRGVVLVFRDVAERRRLEEERARLLASERAARAEAEKASRTKDEFIATVSHELRTPLNAVLGWARLLRIGKLDKENVAKAVETIERSATTQARIVDDLLDVARIMRGQLRLDVRPVELIPVIEAAIDTVRPAAEARNIAIAAVLAPVTGTVSADPGRLQQVVWNLLSNAIKFTPPGGRVKVRLERRGDDAVVEVEDTGPGIDPDFLPHVFERFRQADSSSTRRHGGLGIGLAIVRHLVEAHGGTVSARSPGAGRGSTFVVSLPARAPRPHLAAAPSARGVRLPEASAGAMASLRALRVLIVDDDADTLEVVKQLLEQAGAEVTSATSALEALVAVQERPPDVLVSDIGMPGEDGFSLIRKIRGLDPERGGRVPAAALTAYTQLEDRSQAIQAGFQLHLAKPIDPSELTAAVARLAGRAA